MKFKSDTIVGVNNGFLNSRGRVLIFLLVLTGLGVTIYGESLYALMISVLQRQGSSHGLFVPFISGYFIWLKLDKIKGISTQEALMPGCFIVAAGVILFGLSYRSTGFSLPALSFLLIADGMILLLFGREVFKVVSFPLFFLAAMIPLPEAIYTQIADWMRQSSTWGAVALIKALGVPLHREGFNIYLPNTNLFIAHGCSGIRYLLSYLVFGIAYACIFKKKLKTRAMVVIGALPLAITGGILRLWIIFFSAYYIGPIMVEHRPHVLLSWSVFTTLLVAVIAVDQYVSKWRMPKV